MVEKKEEKLFTDEEIENLFIEPCPKSLSQIKSKLKGLVQSYPYHTLGLIFAFGLLLGVALSGSDKKR